MGKRRVNTWKVIIEFVDKGQEPPEFYLEHPTPYPSRNEIYKNFLNGAYSADQARAIKVGVDSGLSESQIIEISDPELTPEIIMEAIEIAKQINAAGTFKEENKTEVSKAWVR